MLPVVPEPVMVPEVSGVMAEVTLAGWLSWELVWVD